MTPFDFTTSPRLRQNRFNIGAAPRLSRVVALVASVAVVVLSACSPAPPEVTSLEPQTGPAGGSTELTLNGQGFAVGVEVSIGGTNAEVKSLAPDGSSVVVLTPGGAPGEVDVVARTKAGGDPSMALRFRYEAVKVVAIEPVSGRLGWADRPEQISATFNQPIDASQGTVALRSGAGEQAGKPADGKASYDEATQKLTFQPTAALESGEHRVTLAGLLDGAGNTVEEINFTFTIEPPPAPPTARTSSRGSSGGQTGARGSGSNAGSRGRTYDEGRLQTSWFGGDLPFVDTRRVDYLWVKDGFEIDGHTFHFRKWPAPEFIGEDAEKRDAEDYRLAKAMAPDVSQAFADLLEHTWKGKARASTRSGDVIVRGRIVDCSTGNTTAKVLVGFGAGAGSTTFDLKFTDARTGELLVAIHHRVVSGTVWSTTDSKFVKWIEKFGETVDKRGLQKLYAKGDKVKK